MQAVIIVQLIITEVYGLNAGSKSPRRCVPRQLLPASLFFIHPDYEWLVIVREWLFLPAFYVRNSTNVQILLLWSGFLWIYIHGHTLKKSAQIVVLV